MNPSTSGWIDKYIFILGKSKVNLMPSDENEFYNQLRQSGFIYGFSVRPLLNLNDETLKLSEDELAKVNLFHTLLIVHFNHYNDHSFEEAVIHISEFYGLITPKKSVLYPSFSYKSKPSKKLESFLQKRIVKGKSVDNQLFSRIISQALLFMDAIVYQAFITKGVQPKVYGEQLEKALMQTCLSALLTKQSKSKYDLLLIELFEASTLFTSYFSSKNNEIDALDHSDFSSSFEKYYLLDLSTFAVWNDLKIEQFEFEFLKKLCFKLELEQSEAQKSIECISSFVTTNSSYIKLFHHVHPVKQFYKESSGLVKMLLLRNKKRLSKEISQNRELLRLLVKSTHANLKKEEKILVKEQLTDIFKTIPSLTIFLLPGGTLLLPLVIKFIPQLLPSSFDDNKIPKK
jgi:hypothetical protein